MIQQRLPSIALFLFGFSSWASGASGFEYAPTRITDSVHVIYGSFDLPDIDNRGFRNNVVIVSTSAGVVILDPGSSAAGGEMVVKQAKTISDAPVVAVFNSHAHGDHWLGNEGIKRHYPNVVIYGHPTMKTRVEGPDGEFWLTLINRLTDGKAGGKRVVAPDKTVNDGDVVNIGDTAFRIYHTGAAHTDNDIMIEIIAENILFMGDVVRNGMLGIMEDDASIKGNIAAIDLIVDKPFKLYIPGHGKAGDSGIAKYYREYLHVLRGTVEKLYDEDLADYEMKPKVVKALSAYNNWFGFDIRVGPNVSRAYLEVEAEAF